MKKKKINSYTTVYQIKKEKPNWNQVSPENNCKNIREIIG
jgi:hypothetical protein